MIGTIRLMILKHPLHGSSKGIFTTNKWSPEEAYEDEVRAAVEEKYFPTVLVPVQHMEMVLQFGGQTRS